jgi:hypothetical protein
VLERHDQPPGVFVLEIHDPPPGVFVLVPKCYMLTRDADNNKKYRLQTINHVAKTVTQGWAFDRVGQVLQQTTNDQL